MIPKEIRSVVAVGALVCLLIVIGLTLALCQSQRKNRSAKAEGRVSEVTGQALDNVAKQTPVIRQDQEEKQREVDSIQGADTRLPDGFGAELQRVRMRDKSGERKHP